jgi:hypothetical protein
MDMLDYGSMLKAMHKTFTICMPNTISLLYMSNIYFKESAHNYSKSEVCAWVTQQCVGDGDYVQ